MDLIGVLLPVCGLAVLCIGLLALGAVLVLRSTGFNFGSIVDVITGNSGGDNDDDEDEFLIPERRKRTSLRDRAASLDFDSTVQKYSGTQASSAPGRSQGLADQYKSSGFGESLSGSPTSPRANSDARDASGGFIQEERPNNVGDESLRRQLRRGRRSDDEAFGGMLDDEGDGTIDY